MAVRCEDICEDFEKHRSPDMVREWKMAKRRWEIDLTQPDLYVLVERCEAVVHVTPINTDSEFSQPRASVLQNGNLRRSKRVSPCPVTPSPTSYLPPHLFAWGLRSKISSKYHGSPMTQWN